MKKIFLIAFLLGIKATYPQTVKAQSKDTVIDISNTFLQIGYAVAGEYSYYLDTAKLTTCAFVLVSLRKNGTVDSLRVLGDNPEPLKEFLKTTFIQLTKKAILFKPYRGKTLFFPVTLMLHAGKRLGKELPDNCWNSLISAFHTKGQLFFPGAQFTRPKEFIVYNTLFLKYPEGYN